MLTSRLAILAATGLAVACSPATETEAPASDEPAAETSVDTSTDTMEAPAETETTASNAEIATVLAGDWRTEAATRDNWRNPAETLAFFEVDPASTVIEIWPGGGWYADVLAPWTAANGGTYIAAHFEADTESEYRRNSRTRFIENRADTALYGEIVMAEFGETTGELVEAGTADAVLSFRNVHNWMMGGWADKAFADFYTALKPGGVLGVVEHRLPETREQDPRAGSGYVHQAYVISMAEDAGFELVSASEINANPADTADHPFGVWTLPPVRVSANRGEEPAEDFDREAYDAIGESDRMTLLFRKPVETPEAEADAE
ncbi:class I SAM-dependent methyltransferase [Maricaulis sp. D1M11]|uniref:class I SAM-dependent methyltransferase n=1 Tax=Maricaulis sp. D1M11 TaxID=3076117 RepID=UPI0039B4683E